MEKPQIKHVRGVAFITLLSVIALTLGNYVGGLSPVVWGLILGMIGGNLAVHPDLENLKPGIKFGEKTILAYAIILMGIPTGKSLNSSAPWDSALIVLLVMVVTIFSALLLYRLFKLNREDGLLIGIGNAVCGASAIAAISGITKADAKSTGMGIAVINILGIIGLFAVPPIVLALDMDTIPGALMTGGTLQALGQAVAAGEAVNPETGLWATTIKLFRVSMLLPIAIVVALSVGRKNGNKPSLKLIPTFLWLFVLTAVVGYIEVLPTNITSVLHDIEKYLLTIAMVAIGWQIQFGKLKNEGPRRLLFGTLIFIIQLVVMYGLISVIQPTLEA
ncbi:YeiH family protein [Phaeocystidibacter luteus]|uniref:Putative sulfate exporter family transporter n=1 Tax=Phaeocystidibacter luteus TaxID=911197 RepID=A0A6N6RJ23_9FLAO|nr:putative sulfate exporter family transporter [Phaeocystidibacter luteus]KAB2805461.1 putative sulfate exporter family transporter [Phaeocystidibacter luteus]